MNYYLAIDIGASSGRHILGWIEEGQLKIDEVYRCTNRMVDTGGVWTWDMDALFEEIKTGMKQCKKLGKVPVSVGIDTWAVDFVLLNAQGKRVGPVVAYRDQRTQGMDKRVYEVCDEASLYTRTGIQKQSFNTIYQLMAIKQCEPNLLEEATAILMIPDYFHYLLSGKMVTEYTNATTTQLVNVNTCEWDFELIEKLGYKKDLFQQIVKPGTKLGDLSKGISDEVCYTCQVVVPATHDTASAVVAIPSTEDRPIYISSGTWSLIGTELKEAQCDQESQQMNYTNEGGYNKRFRYLKNIMGLWMIQCVQKELAPDRSFEQICKEAANSTIDSIVDCNDQRFLAPKHMAFEIQQACRETSQRVPETISEVARVVYRSLAKCYQEAFGVLDKCTGYSNKVLHIVGGGANADFLNVLTAQYIGKEVVAGPVEATAIGNLAVQMISSNEIKNLKDARTLVAKSCELRHYRP